MAKRMQIRIGAIENVGPNTLVSYLRNAGSAAAQIDIAVAFVTSAGLDSILHLLKRVASRGTVRLLTGLYQGFTEPKALKTLLREQRETNGRLSVQVSHDPHFHWKCYFIVGRTKADVIVGSSNLTDDGLRQTGEFNAVLSLQKTSRELHELQGVFDRHWRSRSHPLSEVVLTKYESWRTSADIPSTNRHVPISKILAGGKTPKRESLREPVFWRDCIDGFLSDDTDAVIKELTDWEKRGYDYFSTWKPYYGEGDRIVLFDLRDTNLTVIEIRETTRTPHQTPDGYHFAAYRRVRGIPRRKLVSRRWKSLKADGLIRRKDDVYQARRLTAERFARFVAILKEPAK